MDDLSPGVNKVLLIVDTNYGSQGLQSSANYNHFSLLKTIEPGMGLPCLNHACDANAGVMSDLFGSGYPDAPSGPGFAARPPRR